MTTALIKCPFGHVCEYDPVHQIWYCKKDNQTLRKEDMINWLEGGFHYSQNNAIHIPIPNLVIDIDVSQEQRANHQ